MKNLRENENEVAESKLTKKIGKLGNLVAIRANLNGNYKHILQKLRSYNEWKRTMRKLRNRLEKLTIMNFKVTIKLL